jgi:hypothetical protein
MTATFLVWFDGLSSCDFDFGCDWAFAVYIMARRIAIINSREGSLFCRLYSLRLLVRSFIIILDKYEQCIGWVAFCVEVFRPATCLLLASSGVKR